MRCDELCFKVKDMDLRSRRQHWANILAEQSASGLSKKSFCVEQGINPGTFYYWQRRLQVMEQDEGQSGFQQLLPQGEQELSLRLSSGEVVIHSRSLRAMSRVLQALADA